MKYKLLENIVIETNLGLEIIKSGVIIESNFNIDSDNVYAMAPSCLNVNNIQIKKYIDKGEKGEKPSFDSPGDPGVPASTGIDIIIPKKANECDVNSVMEWYHGETFLDDTIERFDLSADSQLIDIDFKENVVIIRIGHYIDSDDIDYNKHGY